MTEDSDLYKLKEELIHTWDAFYARYGRFTKIQIQSIEYLLAGRNCILVSSTASGKTEAALSPLIERYKRWLNISKNISTAKKLSILYIVPTRALARDLARRLQFPLKYLAMSIQVKTSDEPNFNASRPPELLITTPESFDSLLVKSPRLVKDVRAVVLDEIHLYDNTPRGDQLRILLNRLRRIKKYAFSRGEIADTELQFCALSATVPHPLNVADRYFENPQVVQINNQRQLDAELIDLTSTTALKNIFTELKTRGHKKVLAFCQRRIDSEDFFHLFHKGSPFGHSVFLHHGSLDVGLRRSAEKGFAEAQAALCFATSTLELGIDIGDIDLVILIGPPDSTSAFLQQIGRGNRRTTRMKVACFYRTPIEKALFQVFINAVSSEIFEPTTYTFCPSIIVQQLCSYIKQTRLGEIIPEDAYELFTSPKGIPLIKKSHYDEIIQHLLIKEYFVPSLQNSALRPGPKWQELYEQQAIYANLQNTSRVIDVVDEITGRKLGEIEQPTQLGKTFLFGGSIQRATRIIGKKLIVQSTSEEDICTVIPGFRTLRRLMSPYLTRAIAVELGLIQVNFSELRMIINKEIIEYNETEEEHEHALIFHYSGEIYGKILGDLLESKFKVIVEESNDFYLRLDTVLLAKQLEFSASDVRIAVHHRWRYLENCFDLGSFKKELPLTVRRVAVIDAFQIDEFLCIFNGRCIIDS